MSRQFLEMPPLQAFIKLKKPHACGENRWQVQRTGMDFSLKCAGCGHSIMMPRQELEKQLTEIIKDK